MQTERFILRWVEGFFELISIFFPETKSGFIKIISFSGKYKNEQNHIRE